MRYLVALSVLTLALTGTSAHAATTGSVRITSTVAQGTANPSDFTLEIRSNGSRVSATGNTIVFGGLTPGVVTIAKTDGPSGYRVVWGGDCSPQGTVTIVAGAVRECTATYTLGRSGTLKVDTIVSGGTALPGDATIELRKDGAIVRTGSGATTLFDNLAPGTYVVSATPIANYTVAISGACGSQGAVSVLNNQTITCTVTYTYRGSSSTDGRTDRGTTPRTGR